MRELNQIRDAVIAALENAGLRAAAAFPNAGVRCAEGAEVRVEIGGAGGHAMGFFNYLGETYDEEKGTYLECYGKKLLGEVCAEVYAPLAADCEDACERVSDVLMSSLPDGIAAGDLTWEAIAWDKGTERFVRRGKLQCTALFLAQGETETEQFLDFRLKGVINSERNKT